MKTSGLVSTISYNTEAFLKGKLQELHKGHIIEFWCYMHHMPEDDEAGKKEHYHVLIQPARMIQTEDLREEFNEFVPGEELPRKCLTFRKTAKFDDWGLYVIHDPAYLAAKHQSRRYMYDWSEIVASDFDELNMNIQLISDLEYNAYRNMYMYIAQKKSFSDFVDSYQVPIQQFSQYERAWSMLTKDLTGRGEKGSHDGMWINQEINGKVQRVWIPPADECNIDIWYSSEKNYKKRMQMEWLF